MTAKDLSPLTDQDGLSYRDQAELMERAGILSTAVGLARLALRLASKNHALQQQLEQAEQRIKQTDADCVEYIDRLTKAEQRERELRGVIDNARFSADCGPVARKLLKDALAAHPSEPDAEEGE